MERLRRSKNEEGGNHEIIISKIESMKKIRHILKKVLTAVKRDCFVGNQVGYSELE